MKKINFLWILCFIFLFSSCFKTTHFQQKKYFPKGFKKVYFGLPLNDFMEDNKDATIEKKSVFKFRTTVYGTCNNKDIKKVTYYFDNDGDKPLYEFIIEYNDSLVRNKIVKKLYSKPNFNDVWRFKSKEGFDIMVWKYESKLIIAGKIKDSEWENAE